MSKFDREALKDLERLSRIECTPEEEKSFEEALTKVIDYVELLSEVNTDDISNCTHILKDAATPHMREDIAKDTLSREEFLANSPKQIGGMIQVPLIIKSE